MRRGEVRQRLPPSVPEPHECAHGRRFSPAEASVQSGGGVGSVRRRRRFSPAEAYDGGREGRPEERSPVVERDPMFVELNVEAAPNGGRESKAAAWRRKAAAAEFGRASAV